MLRPTADWEDLRRILARVGPNDSDAIDWTATAERAKRGFDVLVSWLEYVHRQGGRRPVVYTMRAMTDVFVRCKVDLSPLLEYDCWLAQYRWDTTTGKDYGLVAPTPIVLGNIVWSPRAWQCAGNKGPRIAGVPFDVDQDVFFGDEDAFDAWGVDDEHERPTYPGSPSGQAKAKSNPNFAAVDAPIVDGLRPASEVPAHDPYVVDREEAEAAEQENR